MDKNGTVDKLEKCRCHSEQLKKLAWNAELKISLNIKGSILVKFTKSYTNYMKSV